MIQALFRSANWELASNAAATTASSCRTSRARPSSRTRTAARILNRRSADRAPASSGSTRRERECSTICAACMTRSPRIGFAGAAACVAVIAGSFWYEVISRYFFNAPTSWAYDLCVLRPVPDDLPRHSGDGAAQRPHRRRPISPTDCRSAAARRCARPCCSLPP